MDVPQNRNKTHLHDKVGEEEPQTKEQAGYDSLLELEFNVELTNRTYASN